jgi:hypothetical protein
MDIWLQNLTNGSQRRLTTDPSNNSEPIASASPSLFRLGSTNDMSATRYFRHSQ